MIIQCTSCEKKFNVPDAAITASGRLVQCSSCGNKWTQYPIKQKSEIGETTPKIVKKTPAIKKVIPKKKEAIRKSPIPYSKEYMEQKWGTSLKSYVEEKGLSKKVKTSQKIKKTQKQKNLQNVASPSFGFFNYIIVSSILFTFFVGILNFERTRLSRKFPALEPYIDHFFESLNIFRIFILDFFR